MSNESRNQTLNEVLLVNDVVRLLGIENQRLKRELGQVLKAEAELLRKVRITVKSMPAAIASMCLTLT